MIPEEDLTRTWRRWVAENILLGVHANDIERAAASAGIGADVVRAEIARAAQDPYVEAGHWVAQRLRKLESLMQVRVEVARQNDDVPTVEQFTRLPAHEFRRRFYASNRPVKLLAMIDHWPAMRRWTPTHFHDAYGSALVEVCTRREADPNYEINLERHRCTMTMRDFTALVAAGAGNDAYLVANNRAFEKSGLAALLDDVGPLPGYLNDRDPTRTYLWFGAAGTVTPLHHDTVNVLFCQIHGRKRVLLIAPDETPWLYNDVAVYSDVTMEAPDLRRHPLFRYVAPLEVVVGPGEILFVPVGWWHHVRALDTSISISFTNFDFPNEYHWRQPDIRRNG